MPHTAAGEGLPEGNRCHWSNLAPELEFTNALGFKHKELKPQGRGSGVSDPGETREPTYAPETQTRGASVSIPMVAFKERSSQSNCTEQLRYLWPSLTG